jgi:hypothetical protein
MALIQNGAGLLVSHATSSITSCEHRRAVEDGGVAARGAGGDLLPILAGQPVCDALNSDEMLHHILLLMPGHHRLQGYRPSWIEGIHGLKRSAGVVDGRNGRCFGNAPGYFDARLSSVIAFASE